MPEKKFVHPTGGCRCTLWLRLCTDIDLFFSQSFDTFVGIPLCHPATFVLIGGFRQRFGEVTCCGAQRAEVQGPKVYGLRDCGNN